MSLGIEAKKSDFGNWYLEVMDKCGIVDKRYPVKGFPVYMPWGMFLVRHITRAFENELDITGHKPVNFPVVIPEANLKKEKEHVKSFEKEVFWITHAGENALDERICLRPTSETAMYPMYSIWVRSHSDLPLKLYQSVQVYRYETKMTKPLMRGREFFWIEAHTAQKSPQAVREQIQQDMSITQKVLAGYLGIPFLLFQRPEWDKFPGAEISYAYDTLLPDGQCLQVATTHDLGQKFSKPFEIKFANEKGDEINAYQTCFGMGISRMVAAVAAIHGDDKGVIIPPHIAPVQLVVIPIPMKGKEEKVLKKCEEIANELGEEFRVELDLSDHSPGFKFNEWEMKGVPLRIEVGPRDMAKKQVTLVRRDNGKKEMNSENNLRQIVEKVFAKMLNDMNKKAENFFTKNIKDVKDMNELKHAMQTGGFARVSFCDISSKGEKCAERIEKELKAKVRGPVFGKKEEPLEHCIVCGKKAKHVVYVARAY